MAWLCSRADSLSPRLSVCHRLAPAIYRPGGTQGIPIFHMPTMEHHRPDDVGLVGSSMAASPAPNLCSAGPQQALPQSEEKRRRHPHYPVGQRRACSTEVRLPPGRAPVRLRGRSPQCNRAPSRHRRQSSPLAAPPRPPPARPGGGTASATAVTPPAARLYGGAC